MLPSCIVLVFWSSLLTSDRVAHTSDQALLLAEGLAEHGSYEEAITEYERFIYFSTDSGTICQAHTQISKCYAALQNWNAAVMALRRAVSFCPDDSSREERRADIGVLLLAAGQDDAAEVELLRLSTFGGSVSAKNRAALLLGVRYLYQARWDEAREVFVSLRALDAADSLFMLTAHPKNVSPSKARWLSVFLPGLGQIYARDVSNGLNALILNAITFSFLVERTLSRDYGTVALTGVPLFQRYYRGNVLRAEQAARSHNDAVNSLHAERILEAISEHIRAMNESPEE